MLFLVFSFHLIHIYMNNKFYQIIQNAGKYMKIDITNINYVNIS